MANPSVLGPLDLANVEKSKMWLIAFSALSRSKGWQDADERLNITDNFISHCGLDALEKIQFILSPSDITTMKFEDIEHALRAYLKPKERLVIAERTNFHTIKQLQYESVMDFSVRLKKAAYYCNFGQLKLCNDPAEEMIKTALIAGLHNAYIKEKVLEKLTSVELNNSQIIEYIRQLEQRQDFVKISSENNASKGTISDQADVNFQSRSKHFKSTIMCKFCGKSHAIKECPAFGKTCTICHKKNHFANVCMSRRDTHFTSNQEQCNYSQLYSNENKQLHQNGHKQTGLLSVNINGQTIPMQIDTGASVSVIASNHWQQLGKPKLAKCKTILQAYDGHVISTAGEFTARLFTHDKYQDASLIVVNTTKNFGLIGNDLLSSGINYMISLNHIEKAQYIPPITGVIAKMELKHDAKSVFIKARPVPVALQDKVHQELARLEEMGVITPIEFADNASPVVWVKKKTVNCECVQITKYMSTTK